MAQRSGEKQKAEGIPIQVQEPVAGAVRLYYRAGPFNIKPGENMIKVAGLRQRPPSNGWITGFRPDLVRVDGSHPAAAEMHLHHVAFVVGRDLQWAAGEEKTYLRLPPGFGWQHNTNQVWWINYMIHNGSAQRARVYINYELDFIPQKSEAARGVRAVRTKWLDVGRGSYPVFDALRGQGRNGRFTYPDDAPRAKRWGVWHVKRPAVLVGAISHLHPGGLWSDLRLRRQGRTRTIFRSRMHYFNPSQPMSWDMAAGVTRHDWRVQLKPGDELSVHAVYDTSKASWYEVMGIMPLAVSEDPRVKGIDPFSDKLDIREQLSHGRLSENIETDAGQPNVAYAQSRLLADGPPLRQVDIRNFRYSQGDLLSRGRAGLPPVVSVGGRLRFVNRDPLETVFHTVTGCRQPCAGTTGTGFPLADGGQWDSGQLGIGPENFTPASGRAAWTTPAIERPGTYTYFCRTHPWMRGAFRVSRDLRSAKKK